MSVTEIRIQPRSEQEARTLIEYLAEHGVPHSIYEDLEEQDNTTK